jgi:hypothetical protein
VTARTVQGMAPYPGQARCLARGFWPECFRRLNVKGGQRPFPKETRSALDIEGKHVTIQGPSPDLTSSVSVQGSYLAGSHSLAMDGSGGSAGESLCGVVAVTSAVTDSPIVAGL